jgi:hypothetical protein
MKLLTPAIKANTRQTSLRTKSVRQTAGGLQPRAGSAPGVVAKATPGPTERPAIRGHERLYLLRFFPNATRVCIAGSFNNWDRSATPLKHCGKGRWVAELLLKPGRYEYRLVVDGKWNDDTFAQTRVGNPFGGLNCVLIVNAPRNAF